MKPVSSGQDAEDPMMADQITPMCSSRLRLASVFYNLNLEDDSHLVPQ